ncbi:MAG: hypothetical protein JF603_15545 [Acidobacteria bacterium]|nr:hypothetical protein [Acidobacteriota bacterium]
MSDVTTCAACGAQYFRAQGATCVDCGAPLAGPVLAPGGDEVGYELDDWAGSRRDDLSKALADESIAHRWEDAELVVAEDAADRVEVLIEMLDVEVVDEPDDDDGGGVDGAELLSALFVSADVLQSEPSNKAAVIELLEAVEAMPDRPPYGIDAEVWKTLLDEADAVADLLAEEAADEAVAAAARTLRASVRPLV